MLLILLLAATGCSRELPTQYGKSTGQSGNHSLNGFASLRRSFQSNGWKTQDIYRLSDRLRSLDAIVWTPTTNQAPRSSDSEAIAWLQNWLGERPRTLVYVIPDEGSEAEYWRQTRDLAPPEQRLEYRRRYARALAHAMTQRLRGTQTIDRTWFEAKRRPQGSPAWEILIPSSIDDQADHQDVGTRQFRPLVVDEAGTALVMRVSWALPTRDNPLAGAGQRPSRGRGGSQVLVVAGGSQVNNFALTRPGGRRVAQTLLAQSRQSSGQTAQRVGFLFSGIEGVIVSEVDDVPPAAGGMQLLTVWPLSLVTMHLALMGIVTCLILLPIFGRPRRLKERSQSDFADHIHAVAVLMNRSGGESYARGRISDYFRRVRGETSGKWILPEPPSAPRTEPSGRLAHQSASVPAGTLAAAPQPTTDEPQT